MPRRALLAPEFPKLKTAIVACEDDAKKAEVAAFAREKGIEAGVLPIGFRSDMPDVLAAADIVADLSYEGLGITGTLREAMALGVPVIASAAGGNPELVVDGESGLLVPPRDPAAMAAAVRRLLTDAPLAARLARAGRERVEKGFSSEVRLDRIEALYARLISEKSRAGASGGARSPAGDDRKGEREPRPPDHDVPGQPPQVARQEGPEHSRRQQQQPGRHEHCPHGGLR